MDYLEYLFAGFAVFWAGLFVYLLFLQIRLRALMREVGRLEERLREQEEEAERTSVAPAAAGDEPEPATSERRAPQQATSAGAE